MNSVGLEKLRREQAAASDLSSTEQRCPAELWRDLVSGACHVADGFFSDERCYLVVQRSARPGEALSGRRLAILEQLLCGAYQLSVAIDLDLAPSTVAASARSALETLGLSDRPSRVHPLLMLAAIAAGSGVGKLARRSIIIEGASTWQVWSIPRPELGCAWLPPAELAVVACLVEGLSYEEMAQRRGTAKRTIANQIAAAFRRLGVSGRNELLHRLLTSDDSWSTTPTPAPPASAAKPLAPHVPALAVAAGAVAIRRIA